MKQLDAYLQNTSSHQVLFKGMKPGVAEWRVHTWLQGELAKARAEKAAAEAATRRPRK